MRIRRPRGITVTQLMVVTAIGFLGGVYIWKPLIENYKSENIGNTDKSKAKEAREEQSTPKVETVNIIKILRDAKTSAPGLMAIGIGATMVLIGGYKFIIKPRMDRRHREEAESYANFVFEQEIKQMGNVEQYLE